MYVSARVKNTIWTGPSGISLQLGCVFTGGYYTIDLWVGVADLSIGAAAIQAAIQASVAAQLTALGVLDPLGVPIVVTDAEVIVLGGPGGGGSSGGELEFLATLDFTTMTPTTLVGTGNGVHDGINFNKGTARDIVIDGTGCYTTGAGAGHLFWAIQDIVGIDFSNPANGQIIGACEYSQSADGAGWGWYVGGGGPPGSAISGEQEYCFNWGGGSQVFWARVSVPYGQVAQVTTTGVTRQGFAIVGDAGSPRTTLTALANPPANPFESYEILGATTLSSTRLINTAPGAVGQYYDGNGANNNVKMLRYHFWRYGQY